MDPEADPVPPPPEDRGDIRAPPPAAGGRHQGPNSASLSADSVRNNPPSHRSPLTNDIILRISPAAGSATFGYVYIAETELRHQDAITAYFDSAGRDVTVFPCPDFESFIADNNLMYMDVLFHLGPPSIHHPSGNAHPRGKRLQRVSSSRLAAGTARPLTLWTVFHTPLLNLAPVAPPSLSDRFTGQRSTRPGGFRPPLPSSQAYPHREENCRWWKPRGDVPTYIPR